MHINYEVTQDDLIEFYLFHMQYDRRATRARFLQALLGCFVIAVITFGVIAYFKLDAIKGWIVGILIMIAFWTLPSLFPDHDAAKDYCPFKKEPPLRLLRSQVHDL